MLIGSKIHIEMSNNRKRGSEMSLVFYSQFKLLLITYAHNAVLEVLVVAAHVAIVKEHGARVARTVL